MGIVVCIWVSMTSLLVLFHLSEFIIEKYVSDKNRFKKWWRKNVIDIDPYEK